MKIPIRFLKGLIWAYLSIGVLIILTTLFAIFLWPLFSSEGATSTSFLDLMEKVLLWWGLILLPFLKIGQGFVMKHRREKELAYEKSVTPSSRAVPVGDP